MLCVDLDSEDNTHAKVEQKKGVYIILLDPQKKFQLDSITFSQIWRYVWYIAIAFWSLLSITSVKLFTVVDSSLIAQKRPTKIVVNLVYYFKRENPSVGLKVGDKIVCH